MDEVSLFNQPVAAKRGVRAVHKAADCHDIDEGEALIQLAAGSGPDYGASVHGGEAVTAGSSWGSKEGVGLRIG
jgi:hypothetical protein